MGTTAIWLTPSFKNKPVQGKPGQESAGYHGYWITDFTQIDPHLGTNEEMKALIDAAHEKGMKVFFDIITNHTADVIDYEEKQYTYRSKKTFPYKDATGQEFDDRDYVNEPFLGVARARLASFPYTPFFHEGDEDAKTPAWLNDPTMYHNRGDSTFAGESSTYGDFIGLDDLFTERPEVVDGHGRDLQAVGRLRHRRLPDRHRQARQPRVLAEVRARHPRRGQGVENDDFFAFGEVFDGNPAVMSRVHDRRQAPGHARLRLPAAGRRLRQGQRRERPERLLRQGRLVHRRRQQRLPAADVPREPRHGPRVDVPRGRTGRARPSTSRGSSSPTR